MTWKWRSVPAEVMVRSVVPGAAGEREVHPAEAVATVAVAGLVSSSVAEPPSSLSLALSAVLSAGVVAADWPLSPSPELHPIATGDLTPPEGSAFRRIQAKAERSGGVPG